MKSIVVFLMIAMSSATYAGEMIPVKVDSLIVCDYSFDCSTISVRAEVPNGNYSLCRWIDKKDRTVHVYAEKVRDQIVAQVTQMQTVTFLARKGTAFKIIDGNAGIPQRMFNQQRGNSKEDIRRETLLLMKRVRELLRELESITPQ